MTPTTEQQILIEQRVANDGKSPVVAYLLWFFLGGFSAHRFYFGKSGTAILQLLLLWGGIFTTVIFIGFAFLAVAAIWLLVDAFLIPGWIQADRDTMRRRLGAEAVGA